MPCAKWVTSLARAPALCSTRRTASSTPTDSSLGVEGTFALWTASLPSTSTASVKVPPTSTPRSMRSAYDRYAARKLQLQPGAIRAPGEQVRLGRQCAVLGLCEVLVGRAVAVARKRRALACRPLARRCAALRGCPADRRVDLVGVFGEELLCEPDVAGHDPVDVSLDRHREIVPDVAEQGPRRASEVVPVRRQAADYSLAGAQHSRVIASWRK